MSELLPSLKEIEVNPFDLLLDPNNPRYFSDERDRVKDAEIAHAETQARANARMKKYGIRELQASMQENGYVPTDAIFVTEAPESGKYLVREGNRRVTALKGLLNDDEEPECDPGLKKQISRITILLVESNGDEELLNKQISYLLGVRHHGSLKKWSPFARAQNAYKHYLDVAGHDDESFRWDEEIGEKIAKSLSVKTTEILEGFRVYRAMQQVDSNPDVQAAGGVSANLYSLFKEMLAPNRKALRAYVQQDPVTLKLFGEETIERIDRLCHFSVKDRKDAPINRPQEWASFNSILSDDNAEIRDENVRKVVEDKVRPSVVWVERREQLTHLDWSKWLHKVNLILVPVNAGQMLQEKGSEEFQRAVNALTKIDKLVASLKAKTEKA